MTEGWAKLRGAKNWHYFVGQQSICKKFDMLSERPAVMNEPQGPFVCKRCRRLLEEGLWTQSIERRREVPSCATAQ